MVYTKEQAEAYYRELQNSTFKAYSQATLIHYKDKKENECIQKLDEVKRCLQEAWDLLNQNDTKAGYVEFLMKGTSSDISDHPLGIGKKES